MKIKLKYSLDSAHDPSFTDVIYSFGIANPLCKEAVDPGPRPNPIIIAEKKFKHPCPRREKTKSALRAPVMGPCQPWQSSWGGGLNEVSECKMRTVVNNVLWWMLGRTPP